jgi:tetratricopeptide (TPR) repeat protein
MPKCLHKLILIFFSICFQTFDIQAQNQIAQKADSLFNTKNYLEASKIYELLFTDKSVNKENISLKLAYIYEQIGDYPKTLFYLSTYYNLNPNDEVFEKMNKIALENKYFGFERDDINFILMLYQQYYLIILLVLILIGVWILFILFRKKLSQQVINKRHLITVTIYLIFLIAMINGPNSYQSGIVNKKTYLR